MITKPYQLKITNKKNLKIEGLFLLSLERTRRNPSQTFIHRNFFMKNI